MSDTPLHLVLLDFADTARAGELMEGHNTWIDQGFDDEVFLLSGSVPGRGGVVLIGHADRGGVDRRVASDPFVEHGVVTPTVIEIVPSRVATDLHGILPS